MKIQNEDLLIREYLLLILAMETLTKCARTLMEENYSDFRETYNECMSTIRKISENIGD